MMAQPSRLSCSVCCCSARSRCHRLQPGLDFGLLWAVPAGLVLGYVLGRLIGSAAIALRTRNRDTAAPTDFLALALIALSYTAATAIDAWGFLSVFAAGIGLRHAEVLAVREDPHPKAKQTAAEVHPPAETLVSPNTVTEQEMAPPAVAAGVLVAEVFSFGDTLERMLEVLLVGIVGVSLATHWDPRALLLAAGLIVIIRPAATLLLLAHSPTILLQRMLLGWFGIRGIGSIYYLAFVLTHGVKSTAWRELADMTISIVAVSIVVHGLTSQPLMRWYDRQQSRRTTSQESVASSVLGKSLVPERPVDPHRAVRHLSPLCAFASVRLDRVVGSRVRRGSVGAIASIDADSFYGQLNRPSSAPPASIFGPVWSTLYALMGVSVWLLWRRPEGTRRALRLFVGQLAANALWSWLFFAWHQGAFAFLTSWYFCCSSPLRSFRFGDSIGSRR